MNKYEKIGHIQTLLGEKNKMFFDFVERNPPKDMVLGSRVHGMYIALLEDIRELTEQLDEACREAYKIQTIKEDDRFTE